MKLSQKCYFCSYSLLSYIKNDILKHLKNVILNGTKWSEESRYRMNTGFFPFTTLRVRMTILKISFPKLYSEFFKQVL